MSVQQPIQANNPTTTTTFNQQPPKKQYYFVNRDSFVKEDTDIDVGYYIHKQKLGEGEFDCVGFNLSSIIRYETIAFSKHRSLDFVNYQLII